MVDAGFSSGVDELRCCQLRNEGWFALGVFMYTFRASSCLIRLPEDLICADLIERWWRV